MRCIQRCPVSPVRGLGVTGTYSFAPSERHPSASFIVRPSLVRSLPPLVAYFRPPPPQHGPSYDQWLAGPPPSLQKRINHWDRQRVLRQTRRPSRGLVDTPPPLPHAWLLCSTRSLVIRVANFDQ